MKAAFTNRYDTAGFLNPNVKSLLPGVWQQVILSDNHKAEDLIAKLKNKKGVAYAYIERPIPIKPCIAPTDPLYSTQWHLNSNSSPLADINAEQAWNINSGRNDVIIAVCDGGIDYTHPDLDPGNRSRVIAGYDFGSNDSDPMDDLPDGTDSYGGHGTHIAGIIGAIPNNGQQVSGVMWNCKIMPVKMVGDGALTISYPFGAWNWDFSTTAFPSDVADAIDYAVNNGAHVINLSYGFPDMGETLNQVVLRVPLLNEAILNAYYNNVVIVASMGNEYNDGNPTNYPAAFPDVIAVGNTRNNNPPSRYSSSSTGNHICVSAPGEAIISTTRGGSTGPKTGTSMSAPVVSGVAGLIISQGLDRNFNLTNDDVRHILERTAHDVTSAGVGFDNQTGYGIVDAYEALHLLDEPNELFHYNSVGGTSVKTQNLSQWILLCGRWGLAAGTYLNVDQYKITKHVTFDVPFCSTPQVWMRERQSTALSYANPNNGRPFSIITNITNTGFDLEYVAYYVRYNILGQTVNKWVPAELTSTNVAYTAVGVPNFASSASISGPSTVCYSGGSFTVNNLLPVNSITWAPGPNLTITSGQNTSTCTFSATGSGDSWIDVTLNTDCGNIVLPRKTVWAGLKAAFTGPSSVLYKKTGTWSATATCETYPMTYEWWLREDGKGEGAYIVATGNPLILTSVPRSGYSPLQQDILSEPITMQPIQQTNYILYLRAVDGYNNTYTTTERSITAYGDVDLVAFSPFMATSMPADSETLNLVPNPSTSETTIAIESTSGTQIIDNTVEWDLEIYDQGQVLKTKITKLKGREYTLNVSGWKEGVYIVRANYNGQLLSGKLLVKEQ